VVGLGSTGAVMVADGVPVGPRDGPCGTGGGLGAGAGAASGAGAATGVVVGAGMVTGPVGATAAVKSTGPRDTTRTADTTMPTARTAVADSAAALAAIRYRDRRRGPSFAMPLCTAGDCGCKDSQRF
jgi:hypothetical protein